MKLIAPLIILSLMTAPFATSQTIYSWIDSNGVRHLSDTPPGNSAKQTEFYDLSDTTSPPDPVFTSVKPPLGNKTTTNVKSTSQEPQPPIPLSLSISNLEHDQVLRNNRGIVNIQVTKNRKLKIGEQFQLIFDGKPYDAPQTKTLWQLTNIDRGTHVLSVQAFRDGKVIASTSPMTVHLHRARVKPSE